VTSARVLLAEPSAPVANALRGFLEGKYAIRVARTEDEALALLASEGAELVLASESPLFDGEGLCATLKSREMGPAVVLVYPPDEANAEARSASAGAEACLVGPLKAGTVLSCVKNVLKLHSLETLLAPAPTEYPSDGTEPELTAQTSADFQTFRSLLVREVKRARRFRYPVSLVAVGFDGFEDNTAPEEIARLGELAEPALDRLVAALREVDLVAPYRTASWVAFLPHTPLPGAQEVAARLQEALSGLGDTFVTASVGVATHDPLHTNRPLSFGTLVDGAEEALLMARREGGNRIVVAGAASDGRRQKSRISIA
jgi:PleD family two-component response regulator